MPVHDRISNRNRRTLGALFRHPAPNNLAWSDALHLVERLGTVRQEPNGRLLLTMGDHRHVFHQPRGKELTTQEIAELRKFLESTGVTPTTVDVVEGEPAVESQTPDMVVAVDHHQARLFTIEGTSETGKTLRPYDAHHFLHHLTHREEREYRGQRTPEEPSYYSEIAAALVSAGRIVLLGHGTGHSNAAAQLEAVLRAKHPDLYGRIVGTKTVDLSAMPASQLLAEALEMLRASRDGAAGANQR